MTEQVRHGKRSRMVEDLTERIRNGGYAHGERLPGENSLAQGYGVSRGTVRGALSELQRRKLITTETGVGSFVTFDQVPLDQQVGWARALADAGSPGTVELLGISRDADPALAPFGTLITVRRLRRAADGQAVSLETAAVPGTGALADLPERGLVDDSLTATLRAAGLVGAGGEQWIATEPLDEVAAGLLGRTVGELFLRSTRTTRMRDGRLVEHVVSLLDPSRFRFHLTFGESAR